ncbi:VanZ family protein [Salinicola lusitanus]|uniref:VanZ family protein n=1 Tax=Salinicola lusitanus TaxID=1949085 RepID=A0ABZ3CX69_9GAMM|nr:VanZ family protein [Salinicola sp. CR57]
MKAGRRREWDDAGPSRWPRVAAVVATLVWAAGIAWGSLSPAQELPQHLPWDKFNHFIAYAGLALGLRLSGCRWLSAWLAAVTFSIAIEYLQLYVPGRQGGDWDDILANALGASVALGVSSIGSRYRRGRGIQR